MNKPHSVPTPVSVPTPAPVPVSVPVPALVVWPPRPRATAHEIASWIFVAVAIAFILQNKLLPGLLAGLFVYSLVSRITGHLTSFKMAGHKAKLVAVLIMSLALIGIATGVVILLISMIRGHIGHIPEMMEKMKEIVDQFRDWFTSKGIGEWIPNADKLREHASNWLKEHSTELRKFGGESGMLLLHSIIGIVIGAMLSFHESEPGGPLAAAFFERVRRFAKAFQQIFFAQVKISALNTAFTAVYLLIVLPCFHVKLPFATTMIAVTFVTGMLPVIGNLISNSVIVLISLGVGPYVALGSLIFLVLIHKLEYFLDAKIVGGEIHAAAWEILLAMIFFEAAFGIHGVIIAPIVYAYAKTELKDRQLI